MNEKELPELPKGWRWLSLANGKPYANFSDSSHSVDVYMDEDGVNIECDHSSDRWWAPTAVIVAVLKANGVEL